MKFPLVLRLNIQLPPKLVYQPRLEWQKLNPTFKLRFYPKSYSKGRALQPDRRICELFMTKISLRIAQMIKTRNG